MLIAQIADTGEWSLRQWITFGSIVLTVALLLWSLSKGFRRARLRPVFDVLRLVVQVAVAVAIPAITGVETAAALLVGATLVGGVVGFLQGQALTIDIEDDTVFTTRSVVGFLVWGAGLVTMQGAGLANRTGIVQLGQAITWFSIGITLGLILGRQAKVGHALRQAAVTVGALAAIAAPAAVAVFDTPPAAAQTSCPDSAPLPLVSTGDGRCVYNNGSFGATLAAQRASCGAELAEDWVGVRGTPGQTVHKDNDEPDYDDGEFTYFEQHFFLFDNGIVVVSSRSFDGGVTGGFQATAAAFAAANFPPCAAAAPAPTQPPADGGGSDTQDPAPAPAPTPPPRPTILVPEDIDPDAVPESAPIEDDGGDLFVEEQVPQDETAAPPAPEEGDDGTGGEQALQPDTDDGSFTAPDAAQGTDDQNGEDTALVGTGETITVTEEEALSAAIAGAIAAAMAGVITWAEAAATINQALGQAGRRQNADEIIGSVRDQFEQEMAQGPPLDPDDPDNDIFRDPETGELFVSDGSQAPPGYVWDPWAGEWISPEEAAARRGRATAPVRDAYGEDLTVSRGHDRFPDGSNVPPGWVRAPSADGDGYEWVDPDTARDRIGAQNDDRIAQQQRDDAYDAETERGRQESDARNERLEQERREREANETIDRLDQALAAREAYERLERIRDIAGTHGYDDIIERIDSAFDEDGNIRPDVVDRLSDLLADRIEGEINPRRPPTGNTIDDFDQRLEEEQRARDAANRPADTRTPTEASYDQLQRIGRLAERYGWDDVIERIDQAFDEDGNIRPGYTDELAQLVSNRIRAEITTPHADPSTFAEFMRELDRDLGGMIPDEYLDRLQADLEDQFAQDVLGNTLRDMRASNTLRILSALQSGGASEVFFQSADLGDAIMADIDAAIARGEDPSRFGPLREAARVFSENNLPINSARLAFGDEPVTATDALIALASDLGTTLDLGEAGGTIGDGIADAGHSLRGGRPAGVPRYSDDAAASVRSTFDDIRRGGADRLDDMMGAGTSQRMADAADQARQTGEEMLDSMEQSIGINQAGRRLPDSARDAMGPAPRRPQGDGRWDLDDPEASSTGIHDPAETPIGDVAGAEPGTTGTRPDEPTGPGATDRFPEEATEPPPPREAASPVDSLPARGERVAGPPDAAGVSQRTMRGTDGHGRIYDPYGNHIATSLPDGSLVTPHGDPIGQLVANDGVKPTGYRTPDDRSVMFDRDGRPSYIDPNGSVRPATDIPASPTTGRNGLSADVRTQWDAAGAGPNGELYGPRGEVIGSIDSNGRMTTLDGQEITGYGQLHGGRHDSIRTADGRTHGNAASTPAPPPAAADPDLGELVTNPEAQAARNADADRARAETQEAQRAETNISDPTPERGTPTQVNEPATTQIGSEPPARTGIDPDGAPDAGAGPPTGVQEPTSTTLDGNRTPEGGTPTGIDQPADTTIGSSTPTPPDAEAPPTPTTEWLDNAEPGSRIPPDRIRETGYTPQQAEALQEVAARNDVVFGTRTTNPHSTHWIETGQAVPKPVEIKPKTINEIDELLGGPPASVQGQVGYFEPRRPPADAPPAVHERYRQRLEEYNKLSGDIAELKAQGLIEVKDGVVHKVLDPGPPPVTKPFAGDIDAVVILKRDGTPVTGAEYDRIIAEAQQSGAKLQHGAEHRLVDDVVRMRTQGLEPGSHAYYVAEREARRDAQKLFDKLNQNHLDGKEQVIWTGPGGMTVGGPMDELPDYQRVADGRWASTERPGMVRPNQPDQDDE